jgi:hypothetical protein
MPISKILIKLTPFSEAQPRTFNALLCDGISAHHLTRFDELLALHAQLQQEHPACRILASLDDLAQACYTSGHGTDVYGLDSLEGYDLIGLSADVFENGAHRGYLSTAAEFSIRLANLQRLAQSVEFHEVANVLEWETATEPHDLIALNHNPDAALQLELDAQVIFQFVPVVRAADALAAFPNGYFTADLNPAQNYILACHLEAAHGLALFGVGARFLGFRALQAFDETKAHALATELAAFYHGSTTAHADALARLLVGRDWLLLRYTEN